MAAGAEQHGAVTLTSRRLHDQYTDSRVDEIRVPTRAAIEEDVDAARSRSHLACNRQGECVETDLDQGGGEELAVASNPGRLRRPVRQWTRMRV